MSVNAASVSLHVTEEGTRHSHIKSAVSGASGMLCCDVGPSYVNLNSGMCEAVRRMRVSAAVHLADVSAASEASRRGDDILPDPEVLCSELTRSTEGLSGDAVADASS